MKIAHLILCHKDPELVYRLVTRLAHPQFHFYIHADRKMDLEALQPLAAMPNVFFVTERVSADWAGFTIVQATINSFKQILASGHEYEYINLLSGQDYPIVPAQTIYDFFINKPGRIFTLIEPLTHQWQEAFQKIARYHFVRIRFRGRHTIERMANAVIPRREFPTDFVPVGRAQWITLPQKCVAYILDFLKKKPGIARKFRYMWAPDEMIFQSVLYNSHFRGNIVNDNLRYVDWSERKPSPKTLTIADADAILTSGKLFARKFDQKVDPDILDYLDAVIDNKPTQAPPDEQ